jgi:endonuclease/exonuclease/phosphatase (EEP) superfamily protein YafD
MFWILLIGTLFVAGTTVAPLSRARHWAIRGLDFPRLQLASLAAALFVAQCILLDFSRVRGWLPAAITLACFCWQLWWILPYTRPWPNEVKATTDHAAERRLSILTSNVLTTNRHADKLIALVRQHEPDVLVTLESDQWWQDQLTPLEADMPHTMQCPLDNLYGMHVYSRLPLEEKEISFLVQEDIPSMHALLTLRTGDKVRMHFLHPAPPSPTENEESSERDAELVIVARSVAESDQPVIVTGDLNDVAWSRTTRLFRKLSGLLDPRVGRGMFNTFHVRYPFLRWPLDHLFHSQHFTVHSLERLPSIGSDHFPLLARLAYTPVKGADQEGLEADHEDQSFAQSIAAEQGVSEAEVPRPGE